MSDNILIKLQATADILGGSFFFANDDGADPEYINNKGLIPNGMYIRLEGSDGSMAYISAFELDNILNTVSNIASLKANQSDIDIIQSLLESKASDTDIAILKTAIDDKADKSDFEDLVSTVNSKVDYTDFTLLKNKVDTKTDKTEFEKLINTVNNKSDKSAVDALVNIVNNKASINEVNNIIKDINVLRATLNSITDNNVINNINTQLLHLTNELKNCGTLADLDIINTKINRLNNSNKSLNQKIIVFENELNKKASLTYVQNKVTDINNTISGLINTVNSKANKTDVAVKANKSDFDSLLTTVTDLNVKVNNINTELKSKVNDFTANIKLKANKNETEKSLNDIKSTLTEKTDISMFHETINRITSRLSNLETKHNTDNNNLETIVSELECEFENILTELRSTTTTQNNIISTQNNLINNIQANIAENTNKLKQPWVRVLSTNEYKNLNKLTDNITIYNPRYKYPNILYFVVDFNVPKAIYIGDIQIAKAEQKGSIGFSYTFPISF